MARKKVTLIQSPNNAVRKVRIGDVELEVMNAIPVIIDGQMGVTMTIKDVDLKAAREDDPREDDQQ